MSLCPRDRPFFFGLVHFRVTFHIIVVVVIVSETWDWGNKGIDYDNNSRRADYGHEQWYTDRHLCKNDFEPGLFFGVKSRRRPDSSVRLGWRHQGLKLLPIQEKNIVTDSIGD